MSKFSCPGCGRGLPAWLSRPVRCACGVVIDDGIQPTIPPSPTVQASAAGIKAASAWIPLHQYAVDHRDDWSESDARKSYDRWNAAVGCGSCKTNWNVYTATCPPDFTSARKFALWGFVAHNYVSEHHAHNPTMDIDDCWLTYWPKPRGYCDRHFVAVTSLAPRRCPRQTAALDSWIEFGLTVHAVNTAAEIDTLRPLYPQVDHWHASEDQAVGLSKRTATINSLADIAAKINHTVLLINSDCEAYGNPGVLVEQMRDKTLTMGIRHNYLESRHVGAVRERWGLDAFVVTPDMARELPRLPFGIGVPIWDYWLPYHFRELGYDLSTVVPAWLYHRQHAPGWVRSDWVTGANVFSQHYDYDMLNGSDAFRLSFG